jgi:hypothetical protein
MLRAFSRSLLDAAVKAEQSAQLPTIGTLTEISQLATPIYGQVDGIGRVTITADGNMHGFSPVMRCVDVEGEVAWIPTDRVLIDDPRLQPVGVAPVTGETATRSRAKK